MGTMIEQLQRLIAWEVSIKMCFMHPVGTVVAEFTCLCRESFIDQSAHVTTDLLSVQV